MDREKQLIFGIHPVLEKLKASPAEVEEIIIAEGSARSAARSVDVAARRVGVRVNYASPAALDRLAASQRHQGVVAKSVTIA
jgi:23S rRNA (guanosine2251-2'-O)-methyltransferase